MQRFFYDFAWDAAKSTGNARKHGIEFDLAATVFGDPLAATRYDEDHSGPEDRWVTLGRAETGALLIVIHTFQETATNRARVRLISARPATTHERRQYQQSR